MPAKVQFDWEMWAGASGKRSLVAQGVVCVDGHGGERPEFLLEAAQRLRGHEILIITTAKEPQPEFWK